MIYCRRCIIPSTRPGIRFDEEGICDACRNHERRATIDWAARARSFGELVSDAKERHAPYDCLIPVSGGKDSHWQVVTCLENGMHALTVTWRPPRRTEIGERNLRNLITLGVDHIDFSIDPAVEQRFTRAAFERTGMSALPMHMALFNIPLTIAVRFGIPLVVWGEDSGVEYGGAEGPDSGRLDRAWLRKFGVMRGTTARDWISGTLTERDLTAYVGPGDEELSQADVSAIFLGHYFPWDPETSYVVARDHGFKADPVGPRTGHYNYADIDDQFISIHHYLKWYKFGFTRTFDNLSLEIRFGRLTRDDAIRILRSQRDIAPLDDIAAFCEFVKISEREFFEVCERFRDRSIWARRGDRWEIPGFLVPDWEWT